MKVTAVLSKPRISVAAWLFIAATLAAIAWLQLFTLMVNYDDEGYVLWSMREFCAGQPLYTAVYSQYGPLFFVFYRLAHAATGLAFDNHTARLLTLFYWVATSMLCGAMARRLTRSTVAGLASSALTFASLSTMGSEPFHPGALLTTLTALAAFLGLRATLEDRPFLLAACAGGLGVAISLVKINVGAFLLLGTAGWMILQHRGVARLRAVPAACILLALLVVPALTHNHWPEGWVVILAFVFGGAACSVAWTAHLFRRPSFGPASWIAAILSGLVIVLGITAAMVAFGTSLDELLRAVVVAPLHFSGAFSHPIPWRSGVLVTAAVSIVFFAVWLRFRSHPRIGLILTALKLLAGAWFLSHVRFVTEPAGLYRFNFEFGPSLAWIMIVPLPDDLDPSRPRARAWLGWIFLWQTLQTYPIAGSQMSWGSFLWVPLAVAGIHEAGTRLLATIRQRLWRRLAPPAAALLLLAPPSYALGAQARVGWLCAVYGDPLDLPGTGGIRLMPQQVTTLQTLVRNARSHADMVFSFPGMFSFNLWTDRPTPTADNVTHWFSLLDPTRQRAIQARLESDPRSVVIVNLDHLALLTRTGYQPHGQLADFIRHNYTPLFRLGGYEFRVRKGRDVAPLGIAHLENGHRLVLLASPCGQAVAKLRLHALFPGRAAFWESRPDGQSPWIVTPCDAAGHLAGPAVRVTAPSVLASFSRIELQLPRAPMPFATHDVEVTLTDAKNRVVERFRIDELPAGH